MKKLLLLVFVAALAGCTVIQYKIRACQSSTVTVSDISSTLEREGPAMKKAPQ